MRFRALRDRIYADFFMPSRLPALRALLARALDAGYRAVSVERYWEWIREGRAHEVPRVLVLRHDIDTDTRTARAMWELEREMGIQGSFFFRLRTLDADLAREIAAAGGHASYHYEELASLAKALRLRDGEQVHAHLAQARDLFARNLAGLRRTTGLEMSIVASHGDFANRHTGIPNWVILEDAEFRARTGVTLETYDAAFMDLVTSRHSDTLYPTYWRPDDPSGAIDDERSVIYLLLHPRHWRVARSVNARDDLRRLLEDVSYRLGPSRA
jgi:hypothetical protein